MGQGGGFGEPSESGPIGSCNFWDFSRFWSPLVSSPMPLASGTSAGVPINQAHIPRSIRKDILEGKDVNLASLLMAAHDVADKSVVMCP